MKPLFKNITKYNANNYKEFTEFHTNKYSFSQNAYTIIMSILLIYCVFINIKSKDILLILLFIGILVLFLGWRLYLPYRRAQKQQKEYQNKKQQGFVFSFYKHYFTLNKQTIYYFKLHRVFETKDYFYLYIDEDNAALVSKKGFEIGTPEDFSNFIKKKCLFKYRSEQ